MSAVTTYKARRHQILSDLAKAAPAEFAAAWARPYADLRLWQQRLFPEPLYPGEDWTPVTTWGPYGLNTHGFVGHFSTGGTDIFRHWGKYDRWDDHGRLIPWRVLVKDDVPAGTLDREHIEVRNLGGETATLHVELEAGSNVQQFGCPPGQITRVGSFVGWKGSPDNGRVRFWATGPTAHLTVRIVRIAVEPGIAWMRYRPIEVVQLAA
jgi:hypothetical protein